jgi:hypothetical protein
MKKKVQGKQNLFSNSGILPQTLGSGSPMYPELSTKKKEKEKESLQFCFRKLWVKGLPCIRNREVMGRFSLAAGTAGALRVILEPFWGLVFTV